MNTRLKQFMAAENITQSQLADSLNVVRASVSHILSGRNNPSYEFIKALMAHYPRLNLEWLMFGKGKMYNSPSENKPESQQLVNKIPVDNDLFSINEEEKEEEINVSSHANSFMPPKTDANPEFSSDINTLSSLRQVSIGQRKVVKVTIFFDDGTYQEL